MLFLINSDDKLFILALNADIACTSALIVRIVLAQRVSLDGDLIAAGDCHVAPIGELSEFPVLVVGIQRIAVTADTYLLGAALALVDLHISLRRIDMGLVAFLHEFDETRHLVVDDRVHQLSCSEATFAIQSLLSGNVSTPTNFVSSPESNERV